MYLNWLIVADMLVMYRLIVIGCIAYVYDLILCNLHLLVTFRGRLICVLLLNLSILLMQINLCCVGSDSIQCGNSFKCLRVL